MSVSQSIRGFCCRQVLDSNGSGGLTSLEFCAAMKKLVRRCTTPLASHAQPDLNEKTCCLSSSQTHPAQHMLQQQQVLHCCFSSSQTDP